MRDSQNKERTILLDKLEQEKKHRALEIINILVLKGFKKIGKDKIKDLENNPDKIDFDVVIEFY